MWRFRFGKDLLESPGAFFLFQGVFPNRLFLHAPKTDNAITVIAGVIFQILGA
jgi:hypothetical protein